jgi:hypothetical protein
MWNTCFIVMFIQELRQKKREKYVLLCQLVKQACVGVCTKSSLGATALREPWPPVMHKVQNRNKIIVNESVTNAIFPLLQKNIKHKILRLHKD